MVVLYHPPTTRALIEGSSVKCQHFKTTNVKYQHFHFQYQNFEKCQCQCQNFKGNVKMSKRPILNIKICSIKAYWYQLTN